VAQPDSSATKVSVTTFDSIRKPPFLLQMVPF